MYVNVIKIYVEAIIKCRYRLKKKIKRKLQNTAKKKSHKEETSVYRKISILNLIGT